MTLRQLLTLTLAPCVLGLLPGASAQIRSRRMPGWPQVPVHAPLTPRDASPAVSTPQVHQITGSIYEYDWIVPTGAGQYHSIGVHRVVQVVNGMPIASHNAVLLAHGDAGNFNSDFMAGTYSPQSLPVYLARNGIDAWGIDYGWALVPASETNFTFMQNWGLQRDIDDLEAALLFCARRPRRDWQRWRPPGAAWVEQ